MSKLGYQPLPVLLRAEPDDARRTSKSTIILGTVATLGTLFAVCGAVAICLIGLNASPRKTLEAKAPAVDVPPFSETPVAPSVASNHSGDPGMLPQNSNQALPGMIAEDHSIIDQTAPPDSVPTSTPVATPQPEASAKDSDLLQGERDAAGGSIPERSLPESVRKKLEKTRRAAEQHRARLEELFEKHAISIEAYKKGEQKYQRQIERYRKEISARTVQADNVAGQN